MEGEDIAKVNMHDLYACYEMIMEDYYERQRELINKQIEEYINKTYVDVKELAKGDKNMFYVTNIGEE